MNVIADVNYELDTFMSELARCARANRCICDKKPNECASALVLDLARSGRINTPSQCSSSELK